MRIDEDKMALEPAMLYHGIRGPAVEDREKLVPILEQDAGLPKIVGID